MTFLISGDAWSGDIGDGALCVVLSFHYDSIEGDGIETCRIIGNSACPTICVVANLKDIGVSVVRLPLSIDSRNECGSTMNLDFFTRAIDREQSVVNTKFKYCTFFIRHCYCVVRSCCTSEGCGGSGAANIICCICFLVILSDQLKCSKLLSGSLAFTYHSEACMSLVVIGKPPAVPGRMEKRKHRGY